MHEIVHVYACVYVVGGGGGGWRVAGGRLYARKRKSVSPCSYVCIDLRV